MTRMRATLTERSMEASERIREKRERESLGGIPLERNEISGYSFELFSGTPPSLCQWPTRQRQTTNACFSPSRARPRVARRIPISRQELGINNIWMAAEKNFFEIIVAASKDVE